MRVVVLTGKFKPKKEPNGDGVMKLGELGIEAI